MTRPVAHMWDRYISGSGCLVDSIWTAIGVALIPGRVQRPAVQTQ
eukprot:CAMPEP_0179212248 /NCGR_PEP_ID=MMETSP0797-20121207/996_1 /TAXON_ID=47934 /ORGANISM="Dinophysis acuminata, Strain DAEP01" /LENGTH=44 /DNA_ID= /DNA_START= /DNA_END= /DNA_ORIENTATION=